MSQFPGTIHFRKCIHTLQSAWDLLKKSQNESTEYEIYRLAFVKESELILEQSGEMLRKELVHFFAVPSRIYQYNTDELLNEGVARNLLSKKLAEQWTNYYSLKNVGTLENYNRFNETILSLVSDFILDAKLLVEKIEQNREESRKRELQYGMN